VGWQEIRLGGARFLSRKSLGSLIWKAIVAGVNHPGPKKEKIIINEILIGCKSWLSHQPNTCLYKNRKFKIQKYLTESQFELIGNKLV